jgi:hypothetical protein
MKHSRVSPFTRLGTSIFVTPRGRAYPHPPKRPRQSRRFMPSEVLSRPNQSPLRFHASARGLPRETHRPFLRQHIQNGHHHHQTTSNVRWAEDRRSQATVPQQAPPPPDDVQRRLAGRRALPIANLCPSSLCASADASPAATLGSQERQRLHVTRPAGRSTAHCSPSPIVALSRRCRRSANVGNSNAFT